MSALISLASPVVAFLLATAMTVTTVKAQSIEEYRNDPNLIFVQWERGYDNCQSLINQMSWEVASGNESVLRTGTHHFYCEGDNIVWFAGEYPKNVKHVVGNNDSYSFILHDSGGGKGLLVRQLKVYANGGAPRPKHLFYTPTVGGIFGFFCFAPLQCKLHELKHLKEYVKFDPLEKLKNGNYQFSFNVDLDKIRADKATASADNPTDEFLLRVGRRGLKHASFELDSQTWLPVRCEGELSFLRQPYTVEVINAVNAAGHRRPDGSKFPDTMAEPEGKLVTEKQGFDCQWKYKIHDGQSVVSEFSCKKPKGDDWSPASMVDFSITDVNYVKSIPENVFQMKGFGLPEPASVGKKQEVPSVSLNSETGTGSGFPFWIAALVIAILFSIVTLVEYRWFSSVKPKLL
jgi:hypothetical protein